MARPRGTRADRYKLPLLIKHRIAQALNVSPRSVERWIADGMPTRAVFGSVRANPRDVADWLDQSLGLTLSAGWWRA